MYGTNVHKILVGKPPGKWPRRKTKHRRMTKFRCVVFLMLINYSLPQICSFKQT